MNILLAGRLGRYAERILALRRLGHDLVYCTLPAPRQKPLPDNLHDDSIPLHVLEPGQVARQVRELISRHEIDVVYSMKNVWDGSLELVDELVAAGVGPVVRHYKEHFCRPDDAERRSLTRTAGQIYINEESLEHFRRLYDVDPGTAHIMDTDYLPAAYMTEELRTPLYETDGRPHLLVAGGVSTTGGRNDIRVLCSAMARHGVHVHIYGGKYVGPNALGVWSVGDRGTRDAYAELAESPWIHLHPHVEPRRFTAEWSVYDAGLMHVRANGTVDAPFQRMNQPNRLAPYLAAGLPPAQHRGGQSAMERLVEGTGVGFVYRDFDELAERLKDRAALAALRATALARRHDFTFERHAGDVIGILDRYRLKGNGA
ncbi:hypothetical protein ACFWDQ_07760 [Streptomyces sp. NPDC060053]|uniref:hypothetical protein n=1 Tax=Streptomyces sp. NPDC060053 TaxID=3347047 RepID=UPI0036765595